MRLSSGSFSSMEGGSGTGSGRGAGTGWAATRAGLSGLALADFVSAAGFGDGLAATLGSGLALEAGFAAPGFFSTCCFAVGCLAAGCLASGLDAGADAGSAAGEGATGVAAMAGTGGVKIGAAGAAEGA